MIIYNLSVFSIMFVSVNRKSGRSEGNFFDSYALINGERLGLMAAHY
jgi:hypothetical protein